MKFAILLIALISGNLFRANAHSISDDKEIWTPEPKVITPAKTSNDAPSDAIILFDGKNLDEWVQSDDKSSAKWDVKDEVFTVSKSYRDIETKRKFTNYQLHIEWHVLVNVTGSGQARGNSGVYSASIDADYGCELQVLNSYNNKNYVNGMAGRLYKQAIPLVNSSKKPGEWQTYEVICMPPKEDGLVKTLAKATVFFNSVLVENNFDLKRLKL